MQRPKLKIESDRFDYLLEAITLLTLITLVAVTAVFYGKLPDVMPKHFNLHGNPDAYGSKFIVWLLPALGMLFYAGFSFLSRYPHTFNYPVKVNEQNAAKIYKKGIMVIRIVKFAIILLFLFINLKMIEIGTGYLNQLSTTFLPVILIAFISIVIFSIIWMRR